MPFKKLFRGAKKVVKAPVRFVRKIIPRELKPFAPYIAASFVPGGGFGGPGILGSQGWGRFLTAAATRGAVDEDANIKDSLMSGIIAASPNIIQSGGEKLGGYLTRNMPAVEAVGPLRGTEVMAGRGDVSQFVKGTPISGGAETIGQKFGTFLQDKVAGNETLDKLTGEGNLWTKTKAIGAAGTMEQAQKMAAMHEKDMDERGIFDMKKRRDSLREQFIRWNFYDTEEALEDALDRMGYADYKATGGRVGAADGLWANIHAKRARIKAGSNEKMRTPGSKGAPTDEALRESQATGGRIGLMYGGFPNATLPAEVGIRGAMPMSMGPGSGRIGYSTGKGVDSLPRDEMREPRDQMKEIEGQTAGPQWWWDRVDHLEYLGYSNAEAIAIASNDEAYFEIVGGPKMAQGGRIRAQEGGLMNLGGMEKDYREEGGFVPIGGQEKADDVPARLSLNEFVMTADAVRNAGGGDIDKGAEVMENLMEHLEAGGKVSKESQGQAGARRMFETMEEFEAVA